MVRLDRMFDMVKLVNMVNMVTMVRNTDDAHCNIVDVHHLECTPFLRDRGVVHPLNRQLWSSWSSILSFIFYNLKSY